MSKLVNPVTVTPPELRKGGRVVMAVVVTCHVTERGYRLYRCPYPPEECEGVPQGDRIGEEEAVMQQLFPVVGWAGIEPDLW